MHKDYATLLVTGSKSTRIFVYEWSPPRGRSVQAEDIHLPVGWKWEGSERGEYIHSNPDESDPFTHARSHLKTLLTHAHLYLPPTLSRIPLLLLETNGTVTYDDDGATIPPGDLDGIREYARSRNFVLKKVAAVSVDGKTVDGWDAVDGGVQRGVVARWLEGRERGRMKYAVVMVAGVKETELRVYKLKSGQVSELGRVTEKGDIYKLGPTPDTLSQALEDETTLLSAATEALEEALDAADDDEALLKAARATASASTVAARAPLLALRSSVSKKVRSYLLPLFMRAQRWLPDDTTGVPAWYWRGGEGEETEVVREAVWEFMRGRGIGMRSEESEGEGEVEALVTLKGGPTEAFFRDVVKADGVKRAVVLDVGLKGTRIAVYEWEIVAGLPMIKVPSDWETAGSEQDGDLFDLSINQSRNKQTTTHPDHLNLSYPVSSYSPSYLSLSSPNSHPYLSPSSPAACHSSRLAPLLTHALRFLPSDTRHTPFLLLNTPSLRRLHNVDPAAYAHLTTTLHAQLTRKFPLFTLHPFSRATDALHGWLAANYTGGYLSSPHPLAHVSVHSEDAHLAFTLAGTDATFYHGPLTSIEVSGTTHSVYTHTFRGLGVRTLWARYEAQLLASATEENEMPILYTPCLPHQSSYRLHKHIIAGTANIAACKAAVFTLIRCTEACAGGQKCVSGLGGCLRGQLPLGLEFGAETIQQFTRATWWHATHGLFSGGGEGDLDVEIQTAGLFEKNWGQLKTCYPEIPTRYLRYALFTSSYLITFLTLGLGLPLPPISPGPHLTPTLTPSPPSLGTLLLHALHSTPQKQTRTSWDPTPLAALDQLELALTRGENYADQLERLQGAIDAADGDAALDAVEAAVKVLRGVRSRKGWERALIGLREVVEEGVEEEWVEEVRGVLEEMEGVGRGWVGGVQAMRKALGGWGGY